MINIKAETGRIRLREAIDEAARIAAELDDHQRELIRQLAEARDEMRPEAIAAAKGGKGMFGKLSEWFS